MAGELVNGPGIMRMDLYHLNMILVNSKGLIVWVEAAGIEPASENAIKIASTCLDH